MLLSYLKKELPEVWSDLGSPTLLSNNSVENNILMLKFLWGKKYLQINDVKFQRIARTNHYFGIFYIVFFVVLILLIFPWNKIIK